VDAEPGTTGFSFPDATEPTGSGTTGGESDTTSPPVGEDTQIPADTTPPEPVDCTGTGPCNDNDACTVNDACQNGICTGTAVNCDDGVVCTADSCKEGTCINSVADGFCKIDNVCYANGDKNPQNTCERCAEPLSKLNWSNLDGPCDDGDSCTTDLCQNGACVGSPMECPDDGNPCTSETCSNGACQTKSATGPCDDGDPCTADDYCDKAVCVAGDATVCPDDGNPCTTETCSNGGCISTPGTGPCDDNDPCTLNDQCSQGACVGGAANPNCAPQDQCTYHKDCGTNSLCAKWQTTELRQCSTPCAGSTDCAASQVCSKLPGSAQVGYCEDALPGGFGAGTPCGDPNTCASGICADGICAEVCLDQAHCTKANHTCRAVYDPGQALVITLCMPNVPGYAVNGQACTQDNVNFQGAFCNSGHCNLLGPSPWACAAACTSENDCPAGQECNLVIYSAGPSPNAIGYDPNFNPPLYDSFTACYTQPQAGFKTDGQSCTSDSECLSAKCLQLSPADPTTYCTSLCTNDAECAAGLVCKLDALTLTSNWLVSSELSTQGPNNNNLTYVRVCRLP
jgi:hypothetical protein